MVAQVARGSLARFRYHTGATLRPLQPGERCPVLFRDIGSRAMVRFLAGQLTRLAGPPSPITYMRTCHYREPYVDYERIGRLVFLRPMSLHPWHAGIDTLYVADGARLGAADSIGFVPGHVALADAAEALAEAHTVNDLRETFGGVAYDELIVDHRAALVALEAEVAATERVAEPVRRKLQSPDLVQARRAREALERAGVGEDELCTAWHHLSRERRARFRDALEALATC